MTRKTTLLVLPLLTLCCFGLLCGAISAWAHDVTVTTLTDETITGLWQECTGETLSVGGQTLALENLREITFGTGSSAATSATSTATSATVENAEATALTLTDGSKLQLTELVLNEGLLQAKTTSELALSIPVANAQVVLLQPAELTKQEALQTEWETLLKKAPEADTLVVLREGALQYYRGEILGMDAERVQFLLDGDTLKVKRAKLLGLLFALKPGVGKALAQKAVAMDRNGNQLHVAEFLRSTPDALTVRLCCGLEVTLPIEKLASVAFSAGKITYLEIANAESARWTPFVSVPGLSAASESFYAPKTNRSLNGNPLTIGGKTFQRGLAMASRSEVVFRLPDNARRFQAVVGIDDEVRPAGHVQLTISADGTELFSGELTGSSEPQTLDLDVSGRARLTIKVDYGQNMDISDHLDFGDARITP